MIDYHLFCRICLRSASRNIWRSTGTQSFSKDHCQRHHLREEHMALKDAYDTQITSYVKKIKQCWANRITWDQFQEQEAKERANNSYNNLLGYFNRQITEFEQAKALMQNVYWVVKEQIANYKSESLHSLVDNHYNAIKFKLETSQIKEIKEFGKRSNYLQAIVQINLQRNSLQHFSTLL